MGAVRARGEPGLLLLFSSDAPDEAPYAFIHLREIECFRDETKSTLTLVGKKSTEACEDFTTNGHAHAVGNVLIVFLLPDGRWQELLVPRLDFSFLDAEAASGWAHEIQWSPTAPDDDTKVTQGNSQETL